MLSSPVWFVGSSHFWETVTKSKGGHHSLFTTKRFANWLVELPGATLTKFLEEAAAITT